MSRVNDVGGMSGFPPIVEEADEPRFHADWEAHVLALNGALIRRGVYDLDEFRARTSRLGADEEMVAHEWLTRVFEPVVKAIPFELRAKLEPAEVFHQVLEHRWYMSQARGRSVPLAEVLTSYIKDVLRHRRDEATIMGPPTETLSMPVITASGRVIDPDAAASDDEEIDWRDLV